MDKTISITLNGHPAPFRLEQDAYDRLARYLDRAAAGLDEEADRTDVLGDLERSVGDKLAALGVTDRGSGDRLFSVADVDGILEEIGTVETGREQAHAEPAAAKRRRLERITERQQLTGVCAGLAEYAQIRVDWVRVGFLAATTATAGLFALVYVALAFMMPVAEPRLTGQSPR